MAMMRLRREDPRVVGSFKLHRRLGAGGMGVVYLGSDRKGQRVALKVIRPDLAEDQEFRSRFAREVSAARRIRGGCTARLVAADLEADRPWFATQYVPGPSLHDKVADEGSLGAAEVAAIGAALSEGLVAVHEAGVVHRDLKPSNILLSPKGPRIIDFGIAWATGASTLTHVGTAVGSPGFLAPEQVRGAAVTPATDVFSLGATLAYASMGDSPFGHGSSEVMLYRVVHEEAQLHGVPDAVAPSSAPVWRRTPRSGRARSNCRCGSRRSRPARHRACRICGRPPRAPAKRTGPPDVSPTPTRSAPPNDAPRVSRAIPALREPLRPAVPGRSAARPPPAAGPRHAAPAPRAATVRPPPARAPGPPRPPRGTRPGPAAEAARTAQRYRSALPQEHQDGTAPREPPSPASATVRVRRRDAARGPGHRGGPGLSGAVARTRRRQRSRTGAAAGTGARAAAPGTAAAVGH